MAGKPPWYQKEVRKKNKEKIIRFLAIGPMRFKDLHKDTKISEPTLSSILQELRQEKQIEKAIDNDTEVYRLTGKGKKYRQHMWDIYEKIDELEKEGAYYEGYGKGTWEAGITSTLIISKNKNLPALDYYNINKLILDQMQNKIEEHLNGKAILAIEIDYSKLSNFLKKEGEKPANSM